MIKILTYKEHHRGKSIIDRYLYLAAYILPFSPEDVLGDDVLEVDGNTFTSKNSLPKPWKTPRKRTDKYTKLLEKYNIIPSPESPQEPLEQDYLLAAKLIWSASHTLYTYIYQSENTESEPTVLPPIRRDHLRNLLTVKMDELDAELTNIGTISNKYNKLLLDEVFRYKTFSKNTHAVKLLEDMDVNVCPYCNRLYTMTLTGNDGKSRPQFDHYKSKSQYPYFAVSLMNLIPSCALCNQSKSDQDVAVLYPYTDEMALDAVFCTKIESGLNYLTGNKDSLDEFSVILDIVSDNLPEAQKEKIRLSDKVFNLTRLYNKHKDYILYLFWKNYVFNDEYLYILCKEFPEIFQSFKDAKSMMYLMDIDLEQWGRRSLGKLTHDIDMEINGKSD